ncbi:MAG: 23S rRNA (adenine(2503)-C(2))-methyltransferase RlmN [Clostridia bacterium]|nr:23S rRNA (adenine(2503)-C(2))-methyltransferase RlmN [Clostridia bacterium]
MSDLPDLLSMTREELRDFALSIGEKPYRGDQIFSFLSRGVDYDGMTSLSLTLREKLKTETEFRLPSVLTKKRSRDGLTEKYLLSLIDGECVECVLMRHDYGTSLCISSQVGCRMGCKFCASTLAGKVRDLYPSELLGQIIAVGNDSGERIDKLVMMGIGEPLDNYANTVKFLRILNDKDGIGLGLRNVSLSTCGIVPGIEKLAEEGLPVTLSVSLHAYRDDVRQKIMPVANKYSLDELLRACRFYFDKTGRRVSFEYTLIAGKNDSREDAIGLCRLLKEKMRVTSHVNIIPLNRVEETGFSPPDPASAERFAAILRTEGQNATVRRSMGADVDAACGQLRRSLQNQVKEL